jgi:hypothetical protein
MTCSQLSNPSSAALSPRNRCTPGTNESERSVASPPGRWTRAEARSSGKVARLAQKHCRPPTRALSALTVGQPRRYRPPADRGSRPRLQDRRSGLVNFCTMPRRMEGAVRAPLSVSPARQDASCSGSFDRDPTSREVPRIQAAWSPCRKLRVWAGPCWVRSQTVVACAELDKRVGLSPDVCRGSVDWAIAGSALLARSE